MSIAASFPSFEAFYGVDLQSGNTPLTTTALSKFAGKTVEIAGRAYYCDGAKLLPGSKGDHLQSFSSSDWPGVEAFGDGQALLDGRLVNSQGGRAWYQSQFREIVVGAIGDSITNNGVDGGSSITNAYSYGLSSWLMAGARQGNYSWTAGPAWGHGGATTATIASECLNWTPLTDPFVTHVAVFTGTNDMGAGMSAASSVAEIQKLWDIVLRAGKIPIACTMLPRSAATDAHCIFISNHHALLQRAAARYGIPCADFLTACLDPTSGNAYNWLPNYAQVDGVHASPGGAWAMGGALNLAVQSLPGLIKKLAPKGFYQSTAAGVSPPNGLFRSFSGTINVPGSAPNLLPFTSSAITGTPTITVYDQAGYAAAYPSGSLAPYGGSNVLELAVGASNNAGIRTDFSSALSGFNAGDRVGLSFNFEAVVAGAEVATLPGWYFGIRSQAAERCMQFGASINAGYVAPNNNAPAGGANDAGFVYMERSLPATFNGSNLIFYGNMGQSAGKTGAKLLLSNIMLINYTSGGAVTF